VVDAHDHRSSIVNVAVVLAASATALVTVLTVRVPRPAPRRPVRRCQSSDVAGRAGGHCAGSGGVVQLTVQRLRKMTETANGTVHDVLVGPVRRRRHRRAVDHQLPDVIEMLVLAVHAGSSPTQAIDHVRPLLAPTIRPAFDLVVHRLQRGRGLADAVGALPELLGHRAVALADGIAAADRYGLPLGPVLDGLADEARAERRRLGEEHARSLSVKLSFPLVTCTLPAFVLIAIVPAVIGSLASLPTSPLRP
jgi:Flp pilus assembly protein TadB